MGLGEASQPRQSTVRPYEETETKSIGIQADSFIKGVKAEREEVTLQGKQSVGVGSIIIEPSQVQPTAQQD